MKFEPKPWVFSTNASIAVCEHYITDIVHLRVCVQGVKSLGSHLHVYAGGLNFMK